ncbi:glycosyltransferase family 2 protein [Candidatus Collierbacteria bacterium]|nr:glycosyltransferase family 2 protein [Candidatus Collierbacteria bacterium]
MKTKISAVINTLNEESNLKDCLESLNFVDEIVLVDMHSTDKTREIAYQFTHNVFLHTKTEYVEPARNFAISKATGNWILIVDADERVPKNLRAKLVEIADEDQADFVRLPRKNLIFSQWIKYSRWWPDYNIRFFKKGKVEWQDAIHSIPVTFGKGVTLEADEGLALEHHNYQTIDQFFDRAMRYARVEAKSLKADGYKFNPVDALVKPFSEFLSRFFAGEGYRDGFHGFVLSLLQAFQTFFIYLLIWQEQGFKAEKAEKFIPLWLKLTQSKARELRFWQYALRISQTPGKFERLVLKIWRKIGF